MTQWSSPFDRRGYHHGNLKEALVEAARRFIAERGLGGFTLVDAARLVGVTPAALYRHFRGREDLVEEVAIRGYTDLANRLARALRGSGTPPERFTRMGEAYLAFAEQEPGYHAAMFSPRHSEEASAASGERMGRTASPSPGETALNRVVDMLASTVPEGFGGADARFVALEVWALAHGIATLDAAGQLPKGPGLPDKYQLLRAGVLGLVHGVAPADKT